MILTPQPTGDGSFTFFSEEFQEHFHSCAGAKREAEEKFLIPCRVAEQARAKSSICLLDICYGLGHNTAAALTEIWRVNPDCQVMLIALEWDVAIARSSYEQKVLNPWSADVVELLGQLSRELMLQTPHLQAQLLAGDARQTIQQAIAQDFRADAIFLDPFSPPKCPQLWTVEFFQFISQCLAPEGYLATYSCAASVRQAMALSGLQFGATAAMGRRSPGTLARFTRDGLRPLSPQEQEHLQTRAAVPYRDPDLQGDRPSIIARRQAEQAETNLESTSQWKKRWLKKLAQPSPTTSEDH